MFYIFMMSLLSFGAVAYMIDEGQDDDDAEAEAPGAPAVNGDLIQGTEGSDDIDGTTGDDTIFALGGDDAVTGDEGNDRVFGADGSDLIAGEGGDDFLRGGGDQDVIIGGFGEDTLIGDAGDDIISSVDIFDEETYIDDLRAASDPSTVEPAYDFDRETGEADTVSGGVGDDAILFGSDDEVTGGDGADIFGTGDWASPDAPATITDFNPNSDVLSYAVRGNAFPYIAFSEEDDGTAVLQVDGETVVILPGVDFLDLDESHLAIIGIPLPNQI